MEAQKLTISYSLTLLAIIGLFVLDGVNIYLALIFSAVCVFISMFMSAKTFKSNEKKIKILSGLNFVITTFVAVILALVLASAQYYA